MRILFMTKKQTKKQIKKQTKKHARKPAENEIITNRLKKQRIKNDITQAALAKQSGVNLKTIRQYEQGRLLIDNASAITVFRLSRVLGVHMETIMQLENKADADKRYNFKKRKFKLLRFKYRSGN